MSTTIENAGRRRARPLRLLGLALVSAVAAVWVAAHAFADDRMPRGTRIEGVGVGGLSPEAAEERLREQLSERANDPVEVRVGNRVIELRPRQVGLEVDAAASVEQVAVGADWDPRHLWDVFTGSDEYDAVVRSGVELEEELRRVAGRVDRPSRRGGVRFEGTTPVPTYPRAGARLDVAAARAAIEDAYPSSSGPVQLPVEELQPRVTRADVDRAMAELAEPAMSGPVTFTFDGGRVTLEPSDYAEHLSVRTRKGELVLRVDRTWLTARLRSALRDAGVAPRDATVRLVAGRPEVVPARQGAAVVAGRAAQGFTAMLRADEPDRSAPLPIEPGEPKVSTAEARAWRIRRVVSSFTTYYPHADYRNVNIGRAAELVDGTVLAPGEEFSLNRTVGERTAENGFAKGFIISNGIFKEDYGGGVSQVATTTFNAAFFAGLEDVEHKPHSFYIDRYPVGREATVAWPSVDLRFRNDTDFGVLVDTSHTPSTPSSTGSITVRMWSTKVWDIESITGERYAFTSPETRTLSGDDCIPNAGYGGFTIDVTRVFRRAGESEVQRRERFRTTYTPSDSVVCR